MAPLWRERVVRDVAADCKSEESLSFAGMLSVQDLQKMSRPGNQDGQKMMKKKKKGDEEFEFSCTVGDPAGGRRPPSNVPRFGVSISGGNQKPAAVDVVLISSDKKRAPQNKSTTNGRKVEENKKLSFGRRMVRSFLSPCQECRAENSTVEVAVS